MNKNKITALTLGLSMMALSVTPTFASEITTTSTTASMSDVLKEQNAFLINLSDDDLGNIAVDLGLSKDEVKVVLEKGIVDPSTGPIRIDGKQDITTLPAPIEDTVVETDDGYQDVTTLPAQVPEDSDKETRPFVNPSKVINALEKIDGTVYLVTDDKIDELSKVSGQSTDFVSNELNVYSFVNLIDGFVDPSTRPITSDSGEYQDVMTLPAYVE